MQTTARLFAADPAKRWAETLFLAYTPIWITVITYVTLTGCFAHWGDAGHMGLGLYLVKTHIEAMDGNCSVESEVGKGTTFKVLLPARKLLEKPIETAVAW